MRIGTRQRLLPWMVCWLAVVVLSACGGSGGGGESLEASVAPVLSIAGQPPRQAVAGSAYSFTPSVTRADNTAVAFIIENRPAWAGFDTRTGALNGTPGVGDAGTTAAVTISVTDGSGTASLPPFDLTVTAGGPVTTGGIPVGPVTPANYEWSVLDKGAAAYIDRDVEFDWIPSRYRGLDFLRTANDDKFFAGAGFITFEVGVPVVVYVAFDERSTVLPEWLQSWTRMMWVWRTGGEQARVYRKVFPAGVVELGGNEMGFNMYHVAIEAAGASAPVIDGEPAKTIQTGRFFQFGPVATDADGDELTFSIRNKPVWARFSTRLGALFGTPRAAHAGRYSDIVVSVSDGQHTVDLPAFDIVVEETGPVDSNRAPQISGTVAPHIAAGSTYTFVPTVHDSNGDTLTYTMRNKPGWLVFWPKLGAFAGTPTEKDVGEYPDIRIEVSDGRETRQLPPFRLSVTAGGENAVPPAGGGSKPGTPDKPNVPDVPDPGNTKPTLTGKPLPSATVGESWSFAPVARDSDGDRLWFSVHNRPVWMKFRADTGRLFGTPTGDDVGAHNNIIIRVSDGKSTTSLSPFAIVVRQASSPSPDPDPSPNPQPQPNAAPTISGQPATSVEVGGSYRFTPTANDQDGDHLTFSISNKPGWSGFNSATGRLSGTPASGDAGTYRNIVIRVSDGTSSRSLPAFTIQVTASTPPPGNRAPTISGSAARSVTAGSTYQFTPTASDQDGDRLTFSIANKPAWASFNSSTGRLSGTPGAGHVGTYRNIVIGVSDGTASRSLPAFDIDVEAISLGSATLTWTPPTRNADGTPLTDLAGYKVYYGRSNGDWAHSRAINNAGVSRYVVENLASGTWYFVVTAKDHAGNESKMSNVASKTF